MYRNLNLKKKDWVKVLDFLNSYTLLLYVWFKFVARNQNYNIYSDLGCRLLSNKFTCSNIRITNLNKLLDVNT